MSGQTPPESAGHRTSGVIEYVRTFDAEQFVDRVWPAIRAAFREERFEDLERAIRERSSATAADAAALAGFLKDLKYWRPQCRRQGRYPGSDPFCEAPNPECVEHAAEGHVLCGMKDCFRRLPTVVLELCSPAVQAADLLARSSLDANALCAVMVWAIGDEEAAAKLFGSPPQDVPVELTRASMGIYLTHFVTRPQIAHAAGALRRCREVLQADLKLSDQHLAGLEVFWPQAAEAGVGLALCYAEP